MSIDEKYMQRCLQLAELGKGYVAPNPMVGAVLVHDGRIIGEGYHRQYGGPHAEVNCIDNVKEADCHLIDQSVIYVSLEPCAHFGKTPPCADLIVQKQIPKVVIGCRDPFDAVNGKGIEKLKQAGVEVVTGVLEKECVELNKRFFTFNQKKRPYIILKWAQSHNKMIAAAGGKPVKISNEFSDRMVHQWRAEEAAIMVGTNTARSDNPRLNVRLAKGKDPVRLVLDGDLTLPGDLHVFDKNQETIVFNYKEDREDDKLRFCKIDREEVVSQMLDASFRLGIQSILVEGGAKLLQSFIDAGLWDEARVIENTNMEIDNGLHAPVLSSNKLVNKLAVQNDLHYYFVNERS